MLEDKDRIFKNLYNDKGSDIDSSLLRGDWKNTKEILSKGIRIQFLKRFLIIFSPITGSNRASLDHWTLIG